MATIQEQLRHQQVNVVIDVADEAADVIDALVEALEKAELWTDEENDVGAWRIAARAALSRARGIPES